MPLAIVLTISMIQAFLEDLRRSLIAMTLTEVEGGRELGRSRVSILVGKPQFGRSVLGCIEADFSTKHSSPKLSENFEKKKMTLFEICRPECNV